MIIIATYGDKFIYDLLPTLKYPYLVVDNSCTLKGDNIIHGDGGWSPGAYIKGLEVEDDWYFFMHDSMIVKNHNFIDKFKKYDVCGWLSFPMFFDNPSQEGYVRGLYSNITDKGCFGPIFYSKKKPLEKVIIHKPETIDQSHGMERGIPCAFKDAGYDMKFIDELDETKLSNNLYEDFIKCRPQRP